VEHSKSLRISSYFELRSNSARLRSGTPAAAISCIPHSVDAALYGAMYDRSCPGGAVSPLLAKGRRA